MNVLDPCSRFHVSNLNIKRDIHVQKIKVGKQVLKSQYSNFIMIALISNDRGNITFYLVYHMFL